jgi:hypothetical protein
MLGRDGRLFERLERDTTYVGRLFEIVWYEVLDRESFMHKLDSD